MNVKSYCYVPIINKKMACKLPIDEIFYIEHRNRRTDFFTKDDDYYMYCKLDHIKKYLDRNFYQYSKNIIINLNMIKSVYDMRVIFDDGRMIFLSHTGYITLKQCYAAHLLGKNKTE